MIFDFGKLRQQINESLDPEKAFILYKKVRVNQIFSINYGKIKYVDKQSLKLNSEKMPNPIIYSYLKDKTFEEKGENEFRITLSCLGIGKFVLNNDDEIAFDPALQLGFNFKQAFGSEVIKKVIVESKPVFEKIKEELSGSNIGAILGQD